MSIGEADSLFFGSSGSPEQDPAFRSVLADLLHTGLRQCGAIGLVGTLLFAGLSVWGLGYELHWTYRAFHAAERESQVVMIALLIVAALSVIGLVLAQMECSLGTGRLFGLGTVLLTTAVVAFEGALRGVFSTEYVVLAYLLVVAIIPFRPSQVLGVGGSVGAVVYLLGPAGVVWGGLSVPSDPMARHLAFIGGASVLVTAASAALYRRHRAFAQAQTELRKNRDLLRRTQEVGEVGGWECLIESGVVQGTEWLWGFLGGSAEGTIDLDRWLGFFPAGARQKVRRSIERCAESGEPFDLEVPVEPAKGVRRWSRIRGEARRRGDGAERISGTLQDITEKRERQQELVEAKEEAERMNRLKSAFLANVSHEIRTPLTSIIGFAGVIEEKTEDLRGHLESPDLGDLCQFAGLIEASGRRLLETLDAVLNLSKLEAGEMDLSIGPIDVAAAVKDAASELRPRAKEENVRLQVTTSSEPLWARADESGLKIVLRSLISNAIKYTEEGGEVRVRSRAGEDAVVLEVEDTGIGMDPEQVSELFEPFRQASEGTSREYEGAGLGLAVTQRAIEKMGGSIEVETEKGKGSRFTVRLPKVEDG